MDNSLSKEATDWREGRRLRAFELKQEGWSHQRIAEALGVSEEQRAKVPELLERGAEAHGFRGEAWTCERVAIVIRREFGVSYHPAHVSRFLKALRQSLQKPQRRANQRDEEAIEHWKEQRWPSLKKGAEGRQDHSVCRSVGLLPVAYGSAHLRPGGKDAHPQRKSHARSPFGDERDNPRR